MLPVAFTATTAAHHGSAVPVFFEAIASSTKTALFFKNFSNTNYLFPQNHGKTHLHVQTF
jgi:hypothetical protein